MNITLTYASGRKDEELEVMPGQTVREAIAAKFGHLNDFLFLGGNPPTNLDEVLESPPVEDDTAPLGSTLPVTDDLVGKELPHPMPVGYSEPAAFAPKAKKKSPKKAEVDTEAFDG